MTSGGDQTSFSGLGVGPDLSAVIWDEAELAGRCQLSYGGRALASCRWDFRSARTFVVVMDDSHLTLQGGRQSDIAMVVDGEPGPAPFLLLEELKSTLMTSVATNEWDGVLDELFGAVSGAMKACGSTRVLFIAAGRSGVAATVVGRRFSDSMVLLVSPDSGVFAAVLDGSKSGTGSGGNFLLLIHDLSDPCGVNSLYTRTKRSLGILGATGETEDGRFRFDLSDLQGRTEAETSNVEMQFWLDWAVSHWSQRLSDPSGGDSAVLGAVREAAEGIGALSEKVAEIQKQLDLVQTESRSSNRDVRVLLREFRAEAKLSHLSSARSVTEVVSLSRLSSILFAPEAELPPTGAFAVRPGTLAALVSTCIRAKPRVAVECGSGSSTVWIAAALRYLGRGHVYALEHEPEYGAQTQYYLDQNLVQPFATIVPAPLEQLNLDGQNWYSRSSLEGLPDVVDFLFIDGPPKAVGDHARAPALSEFASRLRPGSLVLLDDMQRVDEQETVTQWMGDSTLPTLELVVGLEELHVYRVADNSPT